MEIRTRTFLAYCATALLVGIALLYQTPARAADDSATPVVSLTFDDGWANQAVGARILADHGLHGTFYINSGFVGESDYLSWAEINAIAQEGHEIGGHSATHLDLTSVPAETARSQICDDRQAAVDRGYPGLSFAYPFAAVSDDVRGLVKQCGYASGRDVGGLLDEGFPNLPKTESVPPANPFGIRTAEDDQDVVSVERLKDLVTRTESSGGWMPLVFHRVCDACAGHYYISPDVLESFTAWLAQEQADGRVKVLPVGEVITGNALPAPPPTEPVVTAISNPSLEELGADGFPTCYLRQGFGDNTYQYAVVQGRTGERALQLSVTSHASGDRKIVVSQDGGTCAVAVEPGKAYKLSLWVKGDWQKGDLGLTTYLRGQDGTWTYWGISDPVKASDDWTEATYQTPKVPSGANLLSFGVALQAKGEVVVDDFAVQPGSGLPFSMPPLWVWLIVGLALIGAVQAIGVRRWRRRSDKSSTP